MSDMFRSDERLFVGFKQGDKWYNRFKVEKPDRILDIQNTKDDSFVSLAYNFIRMSLKTVYTEDGEPYNLRITETGINDYFRLKYIDIIAVALRAMKVFTGEEKPVFSEWLYCELCSRGKTNSQYHEIRKPWADLIESGDIILNYLDDYEKCKWTAKIPNAFEFEGQMYDTLNMELPDFEDMMNVHEGVRDKKLISETDLKYAYLDCSIKSIKGLDQSKVKAYKKRNGLGALSRDFLRTDDDIEAVEAGSPNPGLDYELREERGPCTHKLRGVDLNNFFFFLDSKKKKDHHSLKGNGIIGQ